jgi:hypothetical protein
LVNTELPQEFVEISNALAAPHCCGSLSDQHRPASNLSALCNLLTTSWTAVVPC